MERKINITISISSGEESKNSETGVNRHEVLRKVMEVDKDITDNSSDV